MVLQKIESFTIGKWGDAQAAKDLDAFDRFFRLVKSEPEGIGTDSRIRMEIF